MNWRDHIVTDPKILRGKPFIRGTRVPVGLILGYLSEKRDLAAILQEFPGLTAEDIIACHRYGRHCRQISIWCWTAAIMLTIGLWLLMQIPYMGYLFIVASVTWVCVDSKDSQLWRYESGLSRNFLRPLPLFFLLVFLWPFYFPWYLGLRLKVRFGAAKLREDLRPWGMSNAEMGPTGLIQPWRGHRL